MKVSKDTQLVVTTPDEVGTMGKVFKALADAGVNVRAYCAYGAEGKGHFYLLTEDNTAAEKAMTGLGYDVKTEEVVAVQTEDKPGTGAQLGTKLGDAGVNITFSYATSTGTGEFLAVFSTSDNDKAVTALS